MQGQVKLTRCKIEQIVLFKRSLLGKEHEIADCTEKNIEK